MSDFNNYDEVGNIENIQNIFLHSSEILKNCNEFLKAYIDINKDFYKKLNNLNSKYTPKIKYRPNNIIEQYLFKITEIFPKIIISQIDSIKFVISGLEKGYDLTSNMIEEQNKIMKTLIKKINNQKDEILKKYIELDKSKNTFFTNVKNVEINLIDNKKRKKNLDLNSLDKIEKSFMEQEILRQELLNNNIDKMKSSEKEYLNSIKIINDLENNFIISSNTIYNHLKNNTLTLVIRMKELFLDFLIFIKNSFQMIITEIDSELPLLNHKDIKKEYSDLIESVYKKNNKLKISNYQPFSLKLIEKGFDYVNDLYLNKKELNCDDQYNIINQINNLLQKKNPNFNEEIEEQILTNKITNNILKFNSENYKEPSEKEIEKICELMKKNDNCLIFLKKLNEFRNHGNFLMPKNCFNNIVKILMSILDNLDIEKNIHTAQFIIILSQTFYKNKDKKVYLQKKIIKNKIFQNEFFWENFLIFSINNGITENLKLGNGEINKLESQKDVDSKFANVVFGQLVTLTDNMIEFGFNKGSIKKLIDPKIKYYKLNDNFKETIYSVLDSKEEVNVNDIKDDSDDEEDKKENEEKKEDKKENEETKEEKKENNEKEEKKENEKENVKENEEKKEEKNEETKEEKKENEEKK